MYLEPEITRAVAASRLVWGGCERAHNPGQLKPLILQNTDLTERDR